ncbi:hypothetical protein [Paraburkholderia sp. UYCP14C]|uniref:hypothetical protein n=1 Tax=Paraburkholderia sp. UYCP14C TaxID=2511130 RepID=UPI00145A030F|nr:hypothetical protein [Paraburkholderia sp. UYCP14C]
MLGILETPDEWEMPAVGLVTRSETRQAPALQMFTQLVRQAGKEIAEARRK